MSNVVKFKRRRRETIRGVARTQLTSALDAVRDPLAVVIVTLGTNGTFAQRSVNADNGISEFDMYSRAGALMDVERYDLLGGRS